MNQASGNPLAGTLQPNGITPEDAARDARRRRILTLRRLRIETLRQPCLHDQCEACHGTGLKSDGTSCTHRIFCKCPKCLSAVLSILSEN